MIEIIIDKNFIDDFGKYSNEGRNIEKIFLNEKNIFIISGCLLIYIEDNLEGKNLVRWKELFQFLSDNNKLKSLPGQNTLDVDSIYSSINNTDNIIIILTNSIITRTSNDHICYLKDEETDNSFLIKILQTNQITFRSSDFNTNSKLNGFFKKMFACSKTSNRILLISRYANFNCPLIELLKTKFPNKDYWTTLKYDNCESNNVTFLKLRLGATSLKIYTGAATLIHERKIIIGNMIFEFDDDFNKIKSSTLTWSCTCIINSDTVSILRQKETSLDPLN